MRDRAYLRDVQYRDDSNLNARAALHRRLGARFRYAVADAMALPFASGAFDAVIAHHMLYHLPDRPRAIPELARVLRPTIDREGAFRIGTDTGMFVARSPIQSRS